jgi:ubiquinone/menaquinone biosynthesis C-methylase UbiE
MSDLGWLDVTDIHINALLLLEPLHLQYIADRKPDAIMGTVLSAHPAIKWLFEQRYPPILDYINGCLSLAKPNPNPTELRQAEIQILKSMQDWLIYVLDPARYDQLDFLNWDDASLLEMADYEDKIVLDIGSGTGRLAFAVAPFAQVVYAVEPVANLRSYLWQKRSELSIENVYPSDGKIDQIPFPDNFADIVMNGHVFGDNPSEEYREMQRVVRDGGLILLHPGTNANAEDDTHRFLIAKGFQFGTFTEPGDGIKRKYWKTIHKQIQRQETTPC